MSTRDELASPGQTDRTLLATCGCMAISGVILVVAILIGTSLIRVDLPFNQIAATMTLSPTVNDGMLRISASTHLPDGAHVWLYADHERNERYYDTQGYAEVEGGTFTLERDVTEWLPGAVTVSAYFDVHEGEQPPHILELFGPNGERLGGPQASMAESSDHKRLYVQTELTIP